MKRLKKALLPVVGEVSDYYSDGDNGVEFWHIGCKFLVLDSASVSVSGLTSKPSDYVLVVRHRTGIDVPVRAVSLVQLKATLVEFEKDPLPYNLITPEALSRAINNIREEQQAQEAVLLSQHLHQMKTVATSAAAKTVKYTALMDKIMPKGQFVLRFEGYPDSIPYSTLKEARRSHSKRNIPHVECVILQGKKEVAQWDTEKRYWLYQF